VDKEFVGMSSESFPATNQRTTYVAVTRGREQVMIFTDDRAALLKAMCRPDDPMSATQLAESTNGQAVSRNGPAFGRRHAVPAMHVMQPNTGRHTPERGLDHER
jgi:hypothetical protein